MDPGDKSITQNTKNFQRKIGNDISNDGDVFSTLWLRCNIQNYSGFDQFLLDYGSSILLPLGTFFYLLLLLS